MKAFVWIVFVCLAGLWTGCAWLLGSALKWAGGLLSGSDTLDVTALLSSWTVPNWVLWWVDAADIQALQMVVLAWAERLQGLWPGVGQALEWLMPLVWFAWGLGMLCLLLLAGGFHLVLRSASPRVPAVQSPAS